MQGDIVVGEHRVSGKLFEIDDGTVWDPGTWSAAESTGYFFAQKVTNVPEGTVVTLELLQGEHGPVTLDSDLNAVCRITDPVHQQIKIVATLEDVRFEKVYGLTGLRLVPADS